MLKMVKQPDYSLIIPCFNEAQHLENSVDKLINILDQFKYSYELIFIDDKSKDNTKNILDFLNKKYQNRDFHFYYHKNNLGRGGTVAEGIKIAKASIVGYIDIDLEVSPIYISEFIKVLLTTSNDVAIGLRHYPFKLFPPNYLLREILSRGYVVFTQKYLQHPFSDTEAGYKFFKKKAIIPILEKITNTKWFWDTEIVVRSYLHGLAITQIPVLFLRRSDKTSTVRIIPDTLEFLRSAYNFYKTLEKQYTKAPGILYRFPWAYKFAMQHLFGNKAYKERYIAIANKIPEGSTVLDVCCGDAQLASLLVNKNIKYQGFDVSLYFVRHNLKHNIKTTLGNLETDPLVNADYIVMQGSLFQFENPDKIIQKLLSYANKSVIISESVNNLEKSSFFNPLVKWIMPIIVSTHHDPHFRFSENSLKALLNKYNPTYINISGKRDLIAIINKN